ncbi:PREDICTED: E3 ubiquitin-protein ligase TRIM39-like [Crocodylus porosus]|uniref:E3 ubiquitin-protein ligase TRIM39-like n=1 Tax=Crocodylus porosus TaxID=8502 RepID=UPI00093F0D0F|nr:PREDICTED: E3 ubiquitin-protein ligase TRIM39-like [Crocodylus porosus]
MASLEDLLAELTCPVCLELLAEPVLLECGHHFCRDCITQCWTPLTEGPFSCPQCRTVYLEPRLASSRALSNLKQLEEQLEALGSEVHELQEQERLQEAEIAHLWASRTTLQHRISSELADLRQFLAQREATLLRELQEAAEAVHWEMEAALGSEQPWLMLTSFPTAPASVTLDPHTAHPALVLSDDLMSVQLGAQRRLLPDNPERFRVYCLVLGQPALTGGCHYWEVEVGNKADWALGVACESLERKGKLASSAHEVCWVLRRNDRGQYLAVASCPQPLTVEAPPRTVGVYVDYERGCVSFYNTVGMEHLHTLSGAFNEPLRPIFYPGCDSVPLRLLHPTL